MKESAKLARIKTSYEGLLFLLEEKRPVTRKELFQVSQKDAKDPEVLKAATSGAWRKAYAQRLVDKGVLIKFKEGRQDRYRTDNEDAVRRILEDHKDGGLLLSRFIFPKEVGPPPSFRPEGVEDPVMEEIEDEVEDDEEQSDVMEVLVRSLVDVRDRLSSLEAKTDKVMSMRAEVIETRKMVINLDKEIRDVVQIFPSVQRCKGIIKEAMDDSTIQIAGPLPEGFKEDVVKAFGPLQARMEHTVAAAELAVVNCKKLVEEVNKASKSKTASIIQNMQVLSELLVDAVGEDTDESKT